MRYFKISWYSREDGPGTRIVLFLQGCSLHCRWCHSPQSQPVKPPVLYYKELCKHCGKCADVCQHHCHDVENGKHIYDRKNCSLCGRCVTACTGNALAYECYEASPEEIYAKLRAELVLLGECGGLTVSGGEPLLQWREVKRLLELCKDGGFHTAVETSAAIPGEAMQQLDPVVDCWLFGLKQTDPERCKEMTGIDMSVVLANLETAVSQSPDKVIIRTPLIPGYTDDAANLERIRKIMAAHGIKELDLLPFNPNTEHYYNAGGIPCYL